MVKKRNKTSRLEERRLMNRVFALKPNARTGLPGVCIDSGYFRVKVQGKRLNFRDKHEAFHTLEQLGEYFRFLCGVQGRRHLIRLAYYTAAYEVYNYLRVNRQLRQDVEGVDPEVRTEMEQMLSKLLVAYGTEKD